MPLKVHLAPTAHIRTRPAPFETYVPKGSKPLPLGPWEVAEANRRSPWIGMLLCWASALATIGFVISLAVMVHVP